MITISGNLASGHAFKTRPCIVENAGWVAWVETNRKISNCPSETSIVEFGSTANETAEKLQKALNRYLRSKIR